MSPQGGAGLAAAIWLSYGPLGFPPSPHCLDRVSDDVPRHGSAYVFGW